MTLQTDAARFFDNFAVAFDTLYDKKRSPFMQWVDRTYRSDMFLRFALSFEALGDLKGKSVLDIGCGSGPYVIEALRRGATKVTALDPAPNMLRLVQDRLEKAGFVNRCQLVNGLFPEVEPLPHDHAIVMGVLDYVESPSKFLEALRSVVRRSAVVSFPSTHWFRTPFRRFRYRMRNCPVYFYNEPGIRQLGSEAGFRTVKIHKIPGAGMDYHVCLKP